MDNANRWFTDLDSMQKICHFLKIPNKNKQTSPVDRIDDWNWKNSRQKADQSYGANTTWKNYAFHETCGTKLWKTYDDYPHPKGQKSVFFRHWSTPRFQEYGFKIRHMGNPLQFQRFGQSWIHLHHVGRKIFRQWNTNNFSGLYWTVATEKIFSIVSSDRYEAFFWIRSGPAGN